MGEADNKNSRPPRASPSSSSSSRSQQDISTPTNTFPWTPETFGLCFVLPFLCEIKQSWIFSAVPLYFEDRGWPLWGFGAVVAASTLARIPMNALLNWKGDWIIAPFLATIGIGGAVCMLAYPKSLWSVCAGVGVGMATDLVQAQASLCHRRFHSIVGRLEEEGQQQHQQPVDGSKTNDADDRTRRGLRFQTFSGVVGYSGGALVGGALYEYGGFISCAILQVVVLTTMALTASFLPVIHASWRDRDQEQPLVKDSKDGEGESFGSNSGSMIVNASSNTVRPAQTPPMVKLSETSTGRCFLPASLLWTCDGLNIFAYVCEWSLFAVYFRDAYGWTSTPTGAAQMAGDLLAALILAATAALPDLKIGLPRPPWNLPLYFASYAVTFAMLAQTTQFGVSVTGQVFMGTVYVFNRQAIHECYVVLSHGSTPIFRTLEFGGQCAFNACLALSSVASLAAYGKLGTTLPFQAVSVFSAVWSVVIFVYFALRYRRALRYFREVTPPDDDVDDDIENNDEKDGVGCGRTVHLNYAAAERVLLLQAQKLRHWDVNRGEEIGEER